MCQYNNDDSSYNYYIWKNAKDIEKEEDFKLREDTINTVSKVYDYYNIDYIKSHAEALRNPELLFSALQSADGGSSEAAELLK